MTNDFIFQIMNKFNASEIVDLDLTLSGNHISLRKKGACTNSVVQTSAETKTVEAADSVCAKNDDSSAAVVSETVSTPTSVPAPEVKTDVLKSPIVGTFYRSPSPDSPAYAEKGTVIKKGNPVCIIEAMKMMNTLNADYDFEVLDVLVENGQLVEFDQPLFAIKKL